MFCSNCGKELYDAARKCPYCGKEFHENDNKFVSADNPADYSHESIVISVLALVFAILGGWLGLVFGIIGLCTNKDPGNRSRCTAAIIIWFVYLIIDILIITMAIASM